MSKVFLIFFPLFFFFFSAGNSHRLSGSGPCREAAPTASPAYRPSAPATRGCLPSPPKPPYLGKFLPSPFARRSRVCQGCAPGGLEGIRRPRKPGNWGCSPPRSTFSFLFQFCIFFFFFPLPESVFRPPAPAGRAGGPGSPVPAPVREPGGPGAGPGAERLGWGVRRGVGQTYRGYLFSHFSFIS